MRRQADWQTNRPGEIRRAEQKTGRQTDQGDQESRQADLQTDGTRVIRRAAWQTGRQTDKGRSGDQTIGLPHWQTGSIRQAEDRRTRGDHEIRQSDCHTGRQAVSDKQKTDGTFKHDQRRGEK
jgi:hypothetical protein